MLKEAMQPRIESVSAWDAREIVEKERLAWCKRYIQRCKMHQGIWVETGQVD
jgi:hypothetical protein